MSVPLEMRTALADKLGELKQLSNRAAGQIYNTSPDLATWIVTVNGIVTILINEISSIYDGTIEAIEALEERVVKLEEWKNKQMGDGK